MEFTNIRDIIENEHLNDTDLKSLYNEIVKYKHNYEKFPDNSNMRKLQQKVSKTFGFGFDKDCSNISELIVIMIAERYFNIVKVGEIKEIPRQYYKIYETDKDREDDNFIWFHTSDEAKQYKLEYKIKSNIEQWEYHDGWKLIRELE
jgi:hypothetical protein